MKQNKTIKSLTQKWRNQILLLAILNAVLCVFVLIYAGIQTQISIVSISIASVLIMFLVGWFVFQVYPDQNQTIRLIDDQLPDLHYSSQLLTASNRSMLEQIQYEKTQAQLSSQAQNLRFPLPWSMVGFNLLLTVITIGCFFWIENYKSAKMQPATSKNSEKNLTSTVPKVQADSLFLKDISIDVQPPTYTGKASYRAKKVDLRVPEGSRVDISAQFSLIPDFSTMVLNQDLISGRFSGNRWLYRQEVNEKSVYKITAAKDSLLYDSPFHLIDILKDQPPVIQVQDLPQYQRFEWYEEIKLAVNAKLSDDYGIKDAYIVATITEGSGESIRFREQKIPLIKSQSGKSISVSKSILAKDFQMEPGNEFYFHIEAIDNKPPDGQISKSPTYFFAINDTSDVEFSLSGDLGVDIMPDYFKSQLQLIIDTEKLIKEQSTILIKDFNFKSNELGYDQKQLRLRYGQFMGEEDDSGLEINEVTEDEVEPEAQSNTDVNVLEEFGHDHDHENEVGQWQDRGTQPPEEHNHAHEHEEGSEDPLEAFLHNHEDAETATFFTVSLKAKLRAALNEMWDAELYLRLFKPQQSLPYQYKALKLLKEIKNHARIYVKRVGFEPIEINEGETRLTKDPESLASFSYEQMSTGKDSLKHLLKLIEVIQLLNPSDPVLIEDEIWKPAGQELAQLSLQKPGEFLLELNALNQLQKKTLPDTSYFTDCQLLGQRLTQIFESTLNDPEITSENFGELSDYFRTQLMEIKE